MKLKNKNKKVFKMLVAVVGASFTITAFQNCGGSNDGSNNAALDYVEQGETPVSPIKVEKTDKILHSRNVANALIQGLGVQNVSNVNNLDPIIQAAINSELLLSEHGDYDSITGGQITIHAGNLAEVACERMIFYSEAPKLSVVENEIKDERRFFKGLYIGENAASATPQVPVQDETKYRQAIQRLARSLWGRDTTKAEEDLVLSAASPILLDTKANRGFRAAVVTCTVMASTFDFLRQ
ncbi:MAG: hypothetical protein H6625_04835 [Bdellovibrionaceae bacterium]|nr:hypothetical protein [Pseudobdellovibrionaceae bacterium]